LKSGVKTMNPSYTHGVSDVPLIGKTIGDWLDDIAVEFAANEALVLGLRKISGSPTLRFWTK